MTLTQAHATMDRLVRHPNLRQNTPMVLDAAQVYDEAWRSGLLYRTDFQAELAEVSAEILEEWGA